MTVGAWFQCSAGVAGDMTMASLVDAGADQFAIIDAISSLGIDGWAITFEDVQRCGVRAKWSNVVIDEHDTPHHHRPAQQILDLIGSSGLSAVTRDRAVAVYQTLAEVEGSIHGVDAAEVELHEVGALDSIIDVVGSCAALESLGIEQVSHSAIGVGHGTVTTAHGQFPNPVPAVSRLLAMHHSSTVGVDTTMELATPTGVALMTVLSKGQSGPSMPAMNTRSVGFGAGTADTPNRPNVVQVVVGDLASQPTTDGEVAVEIAVNVDDVTGEVLADAIEQLLAAGAFDAWITPIIMKKGRPAFTVRALCDPARLEVVRSTMITHTGSLGIRASEVHRWPQQRAEHVVVVDGHSIRVKVAAHRVKVEFDDAQAAARALGVPVRDIITAAERLSQS
ncbi:MAG: nickel pincer cofactor biosynthesis protein LarC [Ilumatobacteraceae bacterium]|nr:nickel pincer cofactor biosynthesis protein LarC [Ilumatobacteraceae bacterium]